MPYLILDPLLWGLSNWDSRSCAWSCFLIETLHPHEFRPQNRTRVLAITLESKVFPPVSRRITRFLQKVRCSGVLAVISRDNKKTVQARISHVTTTGEVSPSGLFTESRDIFGPVPRMAEAAPGQEPDNL